MLLFKTCFNVKFLSLHCCYLNLARHSVMHPVHTVTQKITSFSDKEQNYTWLKGERNEKKAPRELAAPRRANAKPLSLAKRARTSAAQTRPAYYTQQIRVAGRNLKRYQSPQKGALLRARVSMENMVQNKCKKCRSKINKYIRNSNDKQ